MYKVHYLVVVSLGMLIASCGASDNNSTSENQPVSQTDHQTNDIDNQQERIRFSVPKEKFDVDAGTSKELITKKGSHIHIPAFAFTRMDGTPFRGKATVTFSEYQTAGEIIASQLPMTYVAPNGDSIQFESAGMFEIRAYNGTEELQLAKGKQVKVELASPVAGKFNFYALDDNTRSWKEEARNLSPEPNRYRKMQEEELEVMKQNPIEKPRKPVKYAPSDQLFDIKADPVQFPEFEILGGVLWKYSGTDKKLDPAINKALTKQEYSFLSMEPVAGEEMIYNVRFSTKKDTVELPLAPVFKGKLMERNEKQMKEKLAQFNQALETRRNLEQQLKNESELLRTFQLDHLGIYNYDRQYKDPNAVFVDVAFTFEGVPHASYFSSKVYLIPEEKLAVICYTKATSSLFGINPRENNRLIAVAGDNEVYGLSNTELRNLQLAKKAGKKCTIDLKRIKGEAKSGKDLDAILAQK